MLFGFAAAIFRNDCGTTCYRYATWHSVVTISAFVALLLPSLPAGAAEPESLDLRPITKVGSLRTTRVVVEVEGKLKLNADGQEVKHLPLKVEADLQYSERVLAEAKQWSEVRLVRSYQVAKAKIRLRESEIVNELRNERRTILVESNTKEAIHSSPLGPLTREELELVESPASGIALESLLPGRVTKIGGQWPLADATTAGLLGLEAISQQNVVCTLDSVKENVAIVTLEGKIAGAIGGVSSDIELKGKLNFDLKQRAITWLTLAYKENRAIGHAQPGFEVLTTLRFVSAPVQAVAELNDKALLAGLPLKSTRGETLIDLTSEPGGFQLIHDRRWQVMTEQHDLTIMRLIDRGDLVAQCNVSRLPALAKGEQLSLEGFQEDVKRTLGKNFGQLVEASQEVNDAGIRILRVLVTGSASELPIQWMYYHLSDDHGHRTALVFTIEASLVERFAQIDRELIAGFHFLPDKQPTLAPPAKTTETEGPALR